MKEKNRENLIEWVKDIGFAVAVAVIVLQFVMPTVVHQHSMENTLQEGDYLFVSKKAYKWFGDPQRGDIIVFQSDLEDGSGKKKLLVKRIIGLGGDRVSITGGCVYINGEALDEDYTKDGYTLSEMEEVTVPQGTVFAMGDNRQNSKDSRDSDVGFVALEDIKGKVVFRLFPLSEIGSVYK